MSEISKRKALEAYPKRVVGTDFHHIDGDANYDFRTGFIKGYDKAMQDFLEKACEWLEENAILRLLHNDKTLVERFKNYMQDEM